MMTSISYISIFILQFIYNGLVNGVVAITAAGSSEIDKTVLYMSPVPAVLFKTGSSSCPKIESHNRLPQVLRLDSFARICCKQRWPCVKAADEVTPFIS